MTNPPTGQVTFLFTDIEGSTKLAQQFPDSLPSALEKHHKILREAIESNNGFVFEIIGDAFCAAFENSIDAVKTSHDAQVNLNTEPWGEVVIKARMGIHIGNVEWNGKRYMGYITLARTARVMSAAYGGQVLISEDAYNQLTEKEITEISYRDLGNRRLKDILQPIKIYQLISKGLPSDFPPLKTLDARPNNLPVQLTSFIGREEEIKKIKELLKNTHLLTLTGPGGAGKTRLSLQVGADIIDEFANGVWFVELAPITDSVLLPNEILKELGIKEEPNKTLDETLTGYLKDKEILIILDNCEHLIDACAILTENLLKACSKLKIIATSREALKCTGEQTYSILSLKTPNLKDELSLEQLSQYEAVSLFIERALAVNTKFRVTNVNAPALAGICSQLDGIPLAIELAAARVKVLTVEKIYERLNNRFSLLTGGKRTALPRQQTLRALIDWSYDLLSQEEKILWSRLSVFNDGWTLESAEEICSDDKVKKEEIFDLLCALTEKSIIIFDEEKDRYRILESLCQYGEERLKEVNEKDVILSKHLHYLMEFAESTEPKLKGSKAKEWLDKLEIEHGNLQAAIDWSLKDGDNEEGARIAGALAKFWDTRGYYTTGRRHVENILNNMKEISKISKAKILNCSGLLAVPQGDYNHAKMYHEESLTLLIQLDDKHGIAATLNNLGNVADHQGDFELAQKYHKESLSLSRKLGDKHGIAVSLNNLANIVDYLGDIELAGKYHKESLELYSELADKRGIASSLHNLGCVASEQGNYQQAQMYHIDSLYLRRVIGDKIGIAKSIQSLAKVAFDLSDYDEAIKLYKESLELYRYLKDRYSISISLNNLGSIAFIREDYKLSRMYYEESLSIRKEIGDKKGLSVSLGNLGLVLNSIGDYKQARIFYKESLSLRLELGHKLGIACCILGFAEIASAEKHSNRALLLLGATITILESMGVALWRDELIQFDKTTKRLHEQLTDEEFSKYWEAGKKLTLDEAVELALKLEKE
jgi:predicted ATPase/class 3 adenylate cyclase